jgi:RNA-directed DNA polymerase
MSGSSIDFSMRNIWRAWRLFRIGKRKSSDILLFEGDLEANLFSIQRALSTGAYHSGPYRRFIVRDNKTREIVVAEVRDRVVHRLLYEYLVPIFDKVFLYDVWSCRKGKGLLGAIQRTQVLMGRYKHCFVWRGDIKKFFDSVDHEALVRAVSRRVSDSEALALIRTVVESYGFTRERERELKCSEKSACLSGT